MAAVWELEGFGFGNKARRRRWDSRHYQAQLAAEATRGTIAAEIRQACDRVRLRRRQIEAVRPQVDAATEALQLNFEGIQGGELRPIEAQQAISALTSAHIDRLQAMVAYNVAQLELLRAHGRPPHVSEAVQ